MANEDRKVAVQRAWVVVELGEDPAERIHEPVPARFVLCLSEAEAMNIAAKMARDGKNALVWEAKHPTVVW